MAKESAFRRVGLEVTRVTGGDLPDTASVVQRIHEGRGRALFTAPDKRGWVARPLIDDLHRRLVEQAEARQRYEELVADSSSAHEIRRW